MAKLAGVYTGQAIILKVFPLFLALFAFLLISPWTSEYFVDVDPTQAFYTITLFFIGFSFLMEGIIAYPDTKGSSTGVFIIGFILLMILSLGSFIFGGAIITEYYDVMSDTSELNTILSIFLGISVLMFFAQARSEIFRGKRLHEAIKGSI
tara:strand:- start:1760 stop:2212 length:453 start_codon:yes stop_codon:yes gene_type:complete